MKVAIALATGVALLLQPGLAQAAPTAARGDVRCLLAMAVAMANESFRQAGTLATMFFLGKILANEPGFDFSTRLKPEAALMTPKDFTDEGNRCGQEVKSATTSLRAAQSSLNSRDPPP